MTDPALQTLSQQTPRSVNCWDSVYSNVRMYDRLCLPVIIDITVQGPHEQEQRNLGMVFKQLQSAEKH